MPLDDRTIRDRRASLATGPVVTGSGVDFEFVGERDVEGVRLEIDFDLGMNPEFVRHGSVWSLHVPRPAVDRLEYQLTVRRGERTDWTADPANPRSVPNPFGTKSEICFPEYRSPRWLESEPAGSVVVVADDGPPELRVPTRLWSPPDLPADRSAPLLVVHDGSDLADRGSLLRWASNVARRRPLRVALLDPAHGSRDIWYAADPGYTEHIRAAVLPGLKDRVNTGAVIGMGASLGAMAMLMIQRQGLLDAAVLQSGSFFSRQSDPQEQGYRSFEPVCAAVAEVAAAPGPPVPVVITVGTVEENRANNEAMAATLVGQGYGVDLRLVRDAHTMIGWRDAWFPAVDQLIESIQSPR